jgi:hypothetical protein
MAHVGYRKARTTIIRPDSKQMIPIDKEIKVNIKQTKNVSKLIHKKQC